MGDSSQKRIGGILLAAGGSTRFGSPKQLHVYDGKTLIRRAAETLIRSKCKIIVVVLGADIDRSIAELDGLTLMISINDDWRTGMSSSIKRGLNDILTIDPDLDAIVITLCDQPHVTLADIDRLIDEYAKTNAPIVAARYADTNGVPALFAYTEFTKLTSLTGDKGARSLISTAHTVDIPAAAFDIDTPDDSREGQPLP